MLGALDYHSLATAVKRALAAFASITNPMMAKGDLIVGTGPNPGTDYARKAAPANGYVRMADSTQTDGWQDVPAAFTFKNRLVNPDGGIYQRVVAATADDTYFSDRWNMLTQTGTVTPSVLTDPEDGFPKGVRITQSQVAAQRFGFSQIIKGRNCKDLRGKSGVLVPRVRISNSQAIRYAILGWTSTEDAVTSDVVNDWTSAVYTAGNFFLAANLSVLVVGAQTPAANTWTSLAAITAALGSAFNNIVVFVWTEGTAAQNVTLDFDYVQFERGSVATEFERRNDAAELVMAQEYYETGRASTNVSNGISTGTYRIRIPFKVTKFAGPTVGMTNSSASNTGSGSAGDILTDSFNWDVGISAGNFARVDDWTAAAEL